MTNPTLAQAWGLVANDGNPTEHEMRDIRERAVSHACYISPEMSAFEGDDFEYMQRLMKTADRIASWIKDGV